MNTISSIMSLENFQLIKTQLGVPSYENDRVAIYQGDCIQLMDKISKGSFQMTITSPPYNIGKEYESILDLEHYLEWCERWMQSIHHLTEDSGCFWLNLGYLHVAKKGLAVPIPYLLWDKTNFFLLQEVVWNYTAGVACRNRFSPRNEKLLWYVKNPAKYTFNLDAVRDPNVKYPNQKKNGKLKCNPLGKNPSDVWQIAKVTSGRNRSSRERTAHPAQFPLELIERIIRASSNQNDVILDPFIGSGTTALAGLKNNRFVIGFEINDEYIDIIKERFKEYDLQNT